MRAIALIAVLIACMFSVAPMAGETGWLGLSFTYHETRGRPSERWLYVRRLAPDGPAIRAGIQLQDLITHIDGKRVAFRNDVAAVTFFRSFALDSA